MSQALVKDLRRDLAALAKRQEMFEDKILGGTAAKEDVEYFKSMALHYADEAKKIRSKILDLLSELGDKADASDPEPATI